MSAISLIARTPSSFFWSPFCSSQYSSSKERSKWFSMERLPRPVMIKMSVMPAATASSTTYWIAGLSTTGSISFGCAFVAGRKRVPRPAAGMTAFVTDMVDPRVGPLSLRTVGIVGNRGRRGLIELLGGDDSVPSTSLRLVQRLVGGADERLGLRAVLREHRDADRHGDRDELFAVAPERGISDPLEHLPRDDDGAFQRRFREDQHELLSPVPRDRVDLSARLGHDAVRQLGEDRVAALVTVAIVDLLEVVDVDHEERKRT